MFNVGDSRTYRLRDGVLIPLTTDHSYVQELVNLGEISPAEARVHPHRNIVTRALGIDDDITVDVMEQRPVTGDRFLLCSDGLVDELDDPTIERVLAGTPDPQAAADELAKLANISGGRDNITLIVVDVVDAGATVTADAADDGGPAATPDVGGWIGDDQPPLDTSAVPPPTSPPEPVVATPPSPAPKRRRGVPVWARSSSCSPCSP